jgi:hypothetical protein
MATREEENKKNTFPKTMAVLMVIAFLIFIFIKFFYSGYK